MELDHINLTVSDVATASTFLKKHFGYKDMFEPDDTDIAILENGSDMHINLMEGSKASYPSTFHIGFNLETETNVTEFHGKLVSEGMKVPEPRHVAWGGYSFTFLCPGSDFSIEVACASE